MSKRKTRDWFLLEQIRESLPEEVDPEQADLLLGVALKLTGVTVQDREDLALRAVALTVTYLQNLERMELEDLSTEHDLIATLRRRNQANLPS